MTTGLRDVLTHDYARRSEKKRVLQDEFHIPMTQTIDREVSRVSTFLQAVEARGEAKGIQKGIQQGIQQGRDQMIDALLISNSEDALLHNDMFRGLRITPDEIKASRVRLSLNPQ